MLHRRTLLAMLVAMSLSHDADAAPPPSTAAGPQPGFLRRLSETRGFMLGRPSSTRPTPDGKYVLFLRSPAQRPVLSLYEYDIAARTTRELLTPEALLRGAEEQLSPAERARRERMRISARGFTGFEISDDGALLLVALSGRIYTVRRADGKVRELPTGQGAVLDPHLSPDGKRVAYVRDRDLYVMELATEKETRLTTSPHPRVTSGLAEFVAQEEMMRFRGYWWSPDGAQIAFEESDTRGVEDFHLIDPMHPEREAEPMPYPRPGRNNAVVRLGVVDVTGGAPAWVTWDAARHPYLATVAWKKGGPLVLAVITRDQRDLEVLAADVPAGPRGHAAVQHASTASQQRPPVAARRLLAEHDDAWINLEQSTPRWLEGGAGFLWTTEREGQRRLELHDPRGALVRVLAITDGSENGAEAEVKGVYDVDEAAGVAYVAASAEPSEMHVFRVPLDGRPAQRLSDGPGEHGAVVGLDHRTLVLHTTRLGAMPRSTVHRLDETGVPRPIGELPSVAEEPPFVPRAAVERAGAADYRALVIRPRAFDPSRRYPVIVDVYGGPHHLHVGQALSGLLLKQWMADHGYIVVAIDGRGTPARGRKWERAIHNDFTVPLDDQIDALRALAAKHKEMDLGRVGITGWSFGGYMAALAVLKRGDFFHVGVAGAPVVDWRDYDTFYTERYLGVPPAAGDTDAYKKSSLLTYAQSLSRPLLLIHGTTDDNVYFLHTLKLADALFRAGKRFELLPLAGLTHMVPDPLIRERLYERIMSTFAATLRP